MKKIIKKKVKCKFGQNSYLKSHVARIHEGKKQFKRDICGTKFVDKGTLSRHFATIHEEKNVTFVMKTLVKGAI